MLRPSNFFTSLAELVSDVEDWLAGDGSWHYLRTRRQLPPLRDLPFPDTSRPPFGMPPDVER